jgi:hypothetical protein
MGRTTPRTTRVDARTPITTAVPLAHFIKDQSFRETATLASFALPLVVDLFVTDAEGQTQGVANFQEIS